MAAIRRALEEDIGAGDATTDGIVPAEGVLSGQIIAKQSEIAADLDVAEAAFHMLDDRSPGCPEQQAQPGQPLP